MRLPKMHPATLLFLTAAGSLAVGYLFVHLGFPAFIDGFGGASDGFGRVSEAQSSQDMLLFPGIYFLALGAIINLFAAGRGLIMLFTEHRLCWWMPLSLTILAATIWLIMTMSM